MADSQLNNVTLTENALDVLKTATWLQAALKEKGIQKLQTHTPRNGKSFLEARNAKGQFVGKKELARLIHEVLDAPDALKPGHIQDQFANARKEADDSAALMDAHVKARQKQAEEKAAEEKAAAEQQRRDKAKEQRRISEEHAAAAQNRKADAPDAEQTTGGVSLSADLPEKDQNDSVSLHSKFTEDATAAPADQPAAPAPEMTEDRMMMLHRLVDYSGGTKTLTEVEAALGQDFFDRLAEDGRGVSFGSESEMTLHYKTGHSLHVTAQNGKLFVTLPEGQSLTDEIARDMVRIQKARGADEITIENGGSFEQRALLYQAAMAEDMVVSENSFTAEEREVLDQITPAPSVNDPENQAFYILLSVLDDAARNSKDPEVIVKAMSLHLSFLSPDENGALSPKLTLDQTGQILDILREDGITAAGLERAFDVSQPMEKSEMLAEFDQAIAEQQQKDPENAEKWQLIADQIKAADFEKPLLVQPTLLVRDGQLDSALEMVDFLQAMKSGRLAMPENTDPAAAPASKQDANLDNLNHYGQETEAPARTADKKPARRVLTPQSHRPRDMAR